MAHQPPHRCPRSRAALTDRALDGHCLLRILGRGRIIPCQPAQVPQRAEGAGLDELIAMVAGDGECLLQVQRRVTRPLAVIAVAAIPATF